MSAATSVLPLPEGLGQPPAGVRVCTAADAQTLAGLLARRVALALSEALAQRPVASLWVSGGSTPLPFFQALSAQVLDWSRVTVGLVDDRWCASDSPDSNAGLVRRHLLVGPAAAASWVGLVPEGVASPFDAEASVQARLDACPWPADVVVLGMGGDGHTASWFPETAQYEQALSPATQPRGVATEAPALPNVPRPRFTLTLGAVRDSRLICLHFTGAAKADLLGRVWRSDMKNAPVGALWQVPRLPGQVMPPVEAYWAP